MATKKYVKEVQKEKGKFGHYKTGTGGGEPIPAGKKWSTEKRDPDQPRTSDGKFSYNSINGKPLKEISKVHGHSRGTTIPPTLTGGVNGVHYYSDSSHEHIVKGGQDALEKYTSLTFENAYRKGDKLIGFDGKVAIASKDFIESASEYVANKGKEEKLTGALAELAEAKKGGKKEEIDAAVEKVLSTGHFAEEQTSSWARKEAETPEEKAALAKATKEETKGHELVERKREEEFAAAPKVKKFIGWASSYSAPSAPKAEEREELASAPISATKDLSDDEIKRFAELTGTSATRGMIEEAIAGDIISLEDIKTTLESKPEVKSEEVKSEEKPVEEISVKEEEKIEDASEEESEDNLIKAMKGIDRDVLLDAVRSEEDVSVRKDILPFAKEWSKDKPEMEGKSDIELVVSYIEEKLGKVEKESKEDAMKEFGLRGE